MSVVSCTQLSPSSHMFMSANTALLSSVYRLRLYIVLHDKMYTMHILFKIVYSLFGSWWVLCQVTQLSAVSHKRMSANKALLPCVTGYVYTTVKINYMYIQCIFCPRLYIAYLVVDECCVGFAFVFRVSYSNECKQSSPAKLYILPFYYCQA